MTVDVLVGDGVGVAPNVNDGVKVVVAERVTVLVGVCVFVVVRDGVRDTDRVIVGDTVEVLVGVFVGRAVLS